MVLGKILKEKRQQKKWSQDLLAEKLQVSRPTISNWESSKTTPDMINLLKISVLYGCTLDDLLKEEITMTTKNFKTMTYNSFSAPLRIKSDHAKGSFFMSPNPEVKANVNLETGEVKFYIEPEELKKLK